MVILIGVKSVFVPFENRGSQGWVKRDDLPRFLTSKEALTFIQLHPEHSFRNGRMVELQWREHDERVLIREYVEGVGTPDYNLKHFGRR